MNVKPGSSARIFQDQRFVFRRGCLTFLSLLSMLCFSVAAPSPADSKGFQKTSFQRIATFPVFLNTDVDKETVAEIVAASRDGNLLIYTDSEEENIGFVNIVDPSNPQPDGIVPVDGEPTSVAVAGKYALAGVNTSEDFINTSGLLQVIDIDTRTIVTTIELSGQPDSVAVSPSGKYAAIAIENERDEDLGDGRPPQFPPGFVVIVDLIGTPGTWATRTVELVGLPDLFPNDPEPEFIDINEKDIAAVTLQENNHIVLIDLKTGDVVRHWNAGTENLKKVDILENDLIQQTGKLTDVPREPDAVTWISNKKLATADEGDLDGGSRGFTIFNKRGKILFRPKNALEHLVARIGHYPEDRSENKGNEPEGIEFGEYRSGDYLFVGSERSNVILVYTLNYGRPYLTQVLPAGVGPEGLLAIPERNLFVVASEVDDRGDKIRSSITIYELKRGRATYPTIVSNNRRNRTPIPWGALSTLAADKKFSFFKRMYTAYDSFYQQSRIFEMVALRHHPAIITKEIVLRTQQGDTVNLDIEGLAVRPYNKGFWVVSEGAGSVDDEDRPVTSLDRLFKVKKDGTILEEIELPASVNALQRRFGFEGVASVWNSYTKSELVYVAFQREWVDDPDDHVRIGRYDTATGEWTFFYYPIDTPTSPNGGWVGLSEIVALDHDRFAVIERDNQGGPDATIKKIYEFSIDGIEPKPQGETFPVLSKTLVRDILPDLTKDNGFALEKVEGLTALPSGDAYIVTDNDGVDDASGETQLLNLGKIFQ